MAQDIPLDTNLRLQQLKAQVLNYANADLKPPDGKNLNEFVTSLNSLIDEFDNMLLKASERETALKQSRNDENMQRGNWSYDIEKEEVLWSDDMYRFVGYEPGEVKASIEAYVSLIHPDMRNRVQRWIASVLNNELPITAFTDRHQIVHPNGVVRTVDAVFTAESNSTGQVTRINSSIRDITEQEDARRIWLKDRSHALYKLSGESDIANGELEQAFKRLVRAAAENLDVDRCSLWHYSEDHRSIVCGALYSATEQAFSDGTVLRAADYPRYFDALETERTIAADDAHTDPRTSEFSKDYLTPLGISSMLDVPIHHGGPMVGVMCLEHVGPRRIWTVEEQVFAASLGDLVAMTLTAAERRKAEEALRKQALVFATITDGVSVVGPEGKVVAWNPAATAMFGFQREEVLNHKTLPLLLPDRADSLESEISDTLAQGERWTGEIVARRKDHSTCICETTIVPILNQNRVVQGRVEVYRDVTDRRGLEEQLHHADRLKSLGVLAGGIAHDFNNQLTGIRAAAELLEGALQSNEPHVRRYLDSIILSSRRASDLTEQLLTFARRQRFSDDVVDVRELVLEVAELLRRSIDKRIAVVTELGDQQRHVRGDASQLQSALLNIALNARDAMPEGGTIKLTIEVEASYQGGNKKLTQSTDAEKEFIVVKASDDGCGMPPEVLARIFEPFFTTKTHGQGIGMGLAAVFGVVEAHHGCINVESTPGEGTTFAVSLPLYTPDESEITSDISDSQQNKSPHSGRHIMVVDDEELIASLVEEILSQNGYKVTVFTDAREAIAHYKKHWQEFDGVILDMIMPHIHGHEVLTQMREANPEVRTIICSGYVDITMAEEVLDRSPLTRLVRKPYEIDNLIKTVDNLTSL